MSNLHDRFDTLLDEAISALQAGVPLEEVLQELPDVADEMRPLLYAALILTDPDPQPAPVARKATLRAEYLRQVSELPPPKLSLSDRLTAVYRAISRRMTREALLKDLLTILITALMTLLMMGAMLTYAAQETLPGDWLYPLKVWSEQSQLSLTFDETKYEARREQLNQTRLNEIEQLIQRQRAAVVTFEGLVEERGETLWIIESYPVVIDGTTIHGDPREGDTVQISGVLRTNTVLVADEIIQLSGREE